MSERGLKLFEHICKLLNEGVAVSINVYAQAFVDTSDDGVEIASTRADFSKSDEVVRANGICMHHGRLTSDMNDICRKVT